MIQYRARYFSRKASMVIMRRLFDETRWIEARVGRRVTRLHAWTTAQRRPYQFSGLYLFPGRWTRALSEVEQALPGEWDCAVLNYYRTGADSCGWHVDDEPEITGDTMTVSLGATRRFLVQADDGAIKEYNLSSGDVVQLSREVRHCVPTADCGPRLSVSFRRLA